MEIFLDLRSSSWSATKRYGVNEIPRRMTFVLSELENGFTVTKFVHICTSKRKVQTPANRQRIVRGIGHSYDRVNFDLHSIIIVYRHLLYFFGGIGRTVEGLLKEFRRRGLSPQRRGTPPSLSLEVQAEEGWLKHFVSSR